MKIVSREKMKIFYVYFVFILDFFDDEVVGGGTRRRNREGEEDDY